MASDKSTMFLFLLVSLSLAQEILQHPKTITVFENNTASFSCEISGGFHSWAVNNVPLNELSLELRRNVNISLLIGENENPQHRLTITARAELNVTVVECLINGGFSDRSDLVSLIIQGPLSKVVDLRAISNASSVTISWIAPFSLDVTDVDPDIWYSVLVYNVTDENNTTTFLCTNCINITETHYTFTPDYPSHCHVYNICIVPLNGAGQGESSSITVGGIKFARESITVANDSKRNVVYNIIGDFNAVTSISFDYGVGRETSYFSGDEGGKVTFTLPAKRKYSASFDVELEYGKMENVSSDYFTTFDTQDFNAEPVDGGIQVTGRYINGSHSRGSFLVIESFSSFFIVLKRNGTDQSFMNKRSMPPSRYTVHAYDLEENGLPNLHPANLDEQTVILNETDNSTQSPESIPTMKASIIQNGYDVTIDCVHDEDNASFVVIYKAHGNSTLNLMHKNNLPLKIQLNRAETMNYTFAVFLMIKTDEETNDIDERAVISKVIKVVADNIPSRTATKLATIELPSTTAGPTPKPSFPPEIDGEDGSEVQFVIGVTIALVILIGILTIFIVYIIVFHHRMKLLKSHGRKHKSHFQVLRECCGSNSCSCQSCACCFSDCCGGDYPTKEIEQSVVTERSTYATVVPLFLGARPPLPLDSTVQYSELNIRATDKMAQCPYAELGPPPANRPEIKRIDAKTESPYVSIVPQTTNPLTDSSGCGIQSAHKTTLIRALPTVESVMSLLMGVAGRWKTIAEGLGFDEDLIDEIDTNNEMNEACLQDCVEQWVGRLVPSWETLSVVLSDNGEDELARLAMKKAPPPQPSEMSVSKMATTAQDCVCCDADVVVPGVQDDTSSTGDNAIGDNANIDNAETCLGLKQDTPRSLSCSMLQEENPIITGEELQEIEAGDSGCPVQQYSVEDEDQGSVSKTPQEVSAGAIAGSDGGVADQEEECILTQSQEGGGSGGEEMVTGVHDRNVPTTNINTNNETLTNSGNSEDRGGKQNMSTDGDCSEDGVRPAVIMCPTLQEEITICHEETSSENSVVTPPNCVEEEDEGESVKVFVTMKSEIFHFPTASYPCFCLNDPSIPGKEDSLPKFICPLNVVFVSDPYSEADEKGVFTTIVGKTNNSSRDKESGVRSGVVKISKSETTVKMMAGGVRMDEFKSYDVFKNIFDSLCSYLTEVLERIRREVDILRAKHDYFSQFLIAESIDEQALLESIGKFYSLYNGDGSVVASMPTRNYQWLGRPDIFHKKFAKWMYAGVALGFHGLDKLIYLKATPPWTAALTGCFGLTLMSGKG